MALEDVVQGVQVTVKTDGVDDAKSKIGELDKAIGDLSKSADSASGGGGRGGGIGGLNKAFSDLSTVGAQAFSQIAGSVVSGNLTGLATLIGGPLAGSITQAVETLSQFTDAQSAATLKTAAMAREFGTTPQAIQGMSAAFGEAGISSQSFERLVTRMSTRVVTDYASMMKNVRTSNDTAEAAAIRVTRANEKLQESYGVNPAVFAANDKWLAQKEDELSRNAALEAQRERQLKDIPHITEQLREGMRAGKEYQDVAETDVNTLVKSIEYLAKIQTGAKGPAKASDVFDQLLRAIQTGAVGEDQARALLRTEMGSRMSSGAGQAGTAPDQLIDAAKHGLADKIVTRTQAEKDAGLLQTKVDEDRAHKEIEASNQSATAWKEFQQKLGSASAPLLTWLDNQKAQFLQHETGGPIMQLLSGNMSGGDAAKSIANIIPDQLNKILGPMFGHVLPTFTGQPKPGEPTPEKKTGAGGEEQPTTEYVGGDTLRGAKMIHIPTGWKGPPDVEKPTETSIGGFGGGKIIQLPPHYNESDEDREARLASERSQQTPVAPRAYDPNDPRYQHMSVADEANAPWRSLRSEQPPAAAPAPAARDLGSISDIISNIFQTALSGLTGGPTPAGGVAPPGTLPVGTAAPVVAPIPPAITVNPASPAITVNVTAPVSVSVSGAATTATPGTGTASVAAGHADGGLISIPGFADGGMIQSFADGGMSQGIPGAWPQDISGNPLSTQAMLKSIKGLSPAAARDFITSHATGSWTEEGVASVLELAGIQASRAAVGTTLGVISNPFGTGMLDATTVGAADRSAGAASEEARARAMGAHNLKELSERESMWSGGIPGFAMGSIRGPGTGTSDSILARVSNGEFVMKDAAVRTYGEGFMHAINNMQIPPPKYAYGGMVPASTVSHFSEGGAMERPGSILNLHVGGEVFKGLKAPAAVADQLRRFALDQQTTQTGRKPTWAGA